MREGDTLYSFARRFGVTVGALQRHNNIADPFNVKIGTLLSIPGQPSALTTRTPSRFIWPLAKVDISSEFGQRFGGHQGIDLRAPRGTAIRASAAGVVHFVGRQRGYGKMIILSHSKTLQTVYAHNLHNLVKKGQQVKQGEVIAQVGRTGNATGYHVHFEIIERGKKINPRIYLGAI